MKRRRFRVEIHLDNAAFEGTDGVGELKRVLSYVSEQMNDWGFLHAADESIRDVNGNKIGGWEISL